MSRRTPLHDRHAAHGARFVDFAGFEMPVWYTGLVEEHLRVRSAVGLFDVSHMGELRVRGAGAAAALDRLVTNDISGLAVGQARYTLMCNHEGGVVDDLVIYRLADDDFLAVVNAANRDKDRAWAEAHLEGADLVDEGDLWCQLALQGPLAATVLAPLTDVALDGVGTYHHALGTVAGVPGCVVARTGYTGEDGFEIYGPSDAAEALWDAVVAAGAPHGLLPIGLGARDTLRLEVRYPLYGHELDDHTAPHQAKLMWTVKLDKPGGFVGAEAIRARRASGADDLRLCGFVIDGKRIAREGTPVVVDGAPVGRVTSGTRAPSLDRSVGLAYVPKALDVVGGSLTLDVRGTPVQATVVKGPFYRRDA
ncbi:MAG: glycine cleavage system aminomethyltransferase GcvT [Alphaproteobacteria bacterium]|nr:glycine cleavage system aminomethyltransferase GcvT [Alphaproteobacteria bacterium]